MSDILVSVCVITYNHCNYIRQCLEGILMQQVDFPIEIIINDDCSTDGTTEIVKEYEKNYQELFKTTYQTENQYSKGMRGMFARFCFPKARGKYIALCEGDDYWTDPLKLQKQVDFLDSHPEYVMCSHMYSSYCQNDDVFYKNANYYSQAYSLDILLKGGWLFQPVTVLFRKSVLCSSKYFDCGIQMDAVLFYFLLQKGDGYYFADNMAVYRVHTNGVWSGINQFSRVSWEYKARLAICEVDRAEESARYLLTQFSRNVGRRFFWSERTLICRALRVVYEYYGLKTVLVILLRKLILGKSTSFVD